jgi:hypothetical protein
MGKWAVVHDALLMCDCGSSPNNLRVMPQHTVIVENNLVATVTDNIAEQQIGPFGQCAKGGPCVPAIPAQWMTGSGSVYIDGKQALRENDFLVCAKGGTVKIMHPLQATTYLDG